MIVTELTVLERVSPPQFPAGAAGVLQSAECAAPAHSVSSAAAIKIQFDFYPRPAIASAAA